MTKNKNRNEIKITEEDLSIPIAEQKKGIVTGRTFVTGVSGSGKSNTVGMICERLLEKGIPLLIVDPEPEHHALKEEYEVLHVGAGDQCEIQVYPEHGSKLAELSLERNVPIILDTSDYVNEDVRNELVKNTIKSLFNKEKEHNKPFLIIVEEAQEFVPENPSLNSVGKWIVKIAKRGRKKGLGLMTTSQRPQDVKKKMISQADLRIWHYLSYETETKIVRKVLNKDMENKVKDLDTGQAIIEGKWIDPVKTNILRKNTVDLGATPTLDQHQSVNLKPVSSNLVDELEKISEEKKKEKSKIERLKNKNKKLKNRIETLEEDLERAKDMSNMAKQFTEALTSSQDGTSTELQEKIDEIREDKEQEISELKHQLKRSEDKVENLKDKKKELKEKMSKLEEYKEAKDKLDEWKKKSEEAKEALARLSQALNIDISNNEERLKEKVRKQREKIENLKDKSPKVTIGDEFEETIDFLHNDKVQREIKEAMSEVSYKEKHGWDILTVLTDKGKVKIDEITKYVDLSKNSIKNILPTLKKHNIIKNDQKGGQSTYYIDKSSLEEIIVMQKKRKRMDDLKEKARDN